MEGVLHCTMERILHTIECALRVLTHCGVCCTEGCVSLLSVCCTRECFSLLSVCCTEEGGRTSDQGYFAHTAREITHCLLDPLSLNFKAFKASPSIYMSTETG